jgi:nucleoside-diphosphate kinase
MNLVHASDSVENATAEIALWFAAAELVDYSRSVDAWIVE